MIPGQQAISGFDPRSIPGCMMWLDAADSNAVSLVGNRVIRWTDKTSNAYYFSNTSVGPTQTTTLNGLNVLTFTASNSTDVNANYLVYPGTVPFNFGQHAIFLVHKPTRTNGSNYGENNAFAVSTALSNYYLNVPFSGNFGALGYRNSAWSTNAYGVMNDVSTAYNISAVNLQLGSLAVTLNGTLQTATPLGGVTSNIISNASNFIGSAVSYSNFYSGNIAEILVYSNGLSIYDQRRVEGYLAWKWGLQSNLPSAHPFSSNQPLTRPLLPIDIPDCIVWFDAADLGTLTLSGSQVTSWRNKGLLAITADTSMGTPTSGFTFNESPLNTVQFGSGAYLVVSNVVTTTSARTQFFVFTVTSYGDGYSRVFASTTATGNRQNGFNAWNRDTDTINFYPAAYSATEYVNITGVSPYSGTLPYNGTSFVIGIRHVANTSSNNSILSNAISVNGSNVALTTSKRLVQGYYVGADTFLLGTGPGYANVQQIGEVIQYDRALTDSETRQVEGYLLWKWNKQGNAPTSHPYATFRPSLSSSFGSNLPGCLLWLDAADTTTLTTSGSSVTSWRDKSGYRNDISFTTSPTTGTVTQNGNNVLAFTSNYGSNLNVKINTANHTLVAVHKPATIDVDNNSIFRFQNGLSGTPYVVFPLFSGGRRGYVTSADGASLSNTGAGLLENSSATSYTLIMASIASASLEVFSNATLVASNTSTLTSADTSGLIFGGITTTALYTGNIAEVMVFNGKLSPPQRKSLESYLSKKWALPLPSNNPFSTVSPGDAAPGLIVTRGLRQWTTPDTYTFAAASWPSRVGNPYTTNASTGNVGLATSPGGRSSMDMSASYWFLDTSGYPVSSTFTLDAWIWLSNAQTSTIFNESGDSAGNSSYASLSVLSNTKGFYVEGNVSGSGNSLIDVSTNGFVPLSQWFNICIVADLTSTLYWNGVSNKSTTQLGLSRPPTTSFTQLGRATGGTTSFRGQLGDVKLYSTTLTSNEVKQNYNAMAPYYGRPVIL